MTDKILTADRINALCNINRWRGWTNRPYSVGEHTAIGAFTLFWFKRPPEQIVRWWMHDMHETEIVGDVPTPDKRMYVNTEFDVAVEDFDLRLGSEINMTGFWWRAPSIKDMDRKMLIVENDLISSKKDPMLPIPKYGMDPMLEMIAKLIRDKTFADPEKVRWLFNEDARRYGKWLAV